MKRLDINEEYDGLDIRVSLDSNKVNMFFGNSGTGKTFLFSVIEKYCSIKSITCVNICKWYMTMQNMDIILKACKEAEVIIADRADLYDIQTLLSFVDITNKIVLVSLKTANQLRRVDLRMLQIKRDGKCLEVI